MRYKLLCTDIDGTLLNKRRQLSRATIREVQRIKQDVPVVLISSRMPKAMRNLQLQLDVKGMPLIAYNGGLVLHGGKVLSSTKIPIDIVKKTVEICKELEVHISLYHNDKWFVPAMDYWAKREQNNTNIVPVIQSYDKTLALWEKQQNGAHKMMVMGEEEAVEKVFQKLSKEFHKSITQYRSKPTYIEIVNNSISKETAIQHLLDDVYTSLSFKDVIAFGDNFNDIEMLKAVGLGIAVANAKPEVIAIADSTTAANIDDGVAIAIKEYL